MTRWLAVAIFLLSPLAARANYVLHPPAEQYFVIADAMTLTKTAVAKPAASKPGAASDAYRVSIRHRGESHEWEVNIFWLADRVSSNTICGGTYKKKMSEYLDAIDVKLTTAAKQKTVPPKYLVELVSAVKDGPLFAAGIFELDAGPAPQRSLQLVSRILKLDAEQAKALKDIQGYLQQLNAVSDSNFDAIRKRPKPTAPIEPAAPPRQSSLTPGSPRFAPVVGGLSRPARQKDTRLASMLFVASVRNAVDIETFPGCTQKF